jgi:glycogen(starch) synthase
MVATGNDTLPTLQIGMGWFPDEAGGLERYYYDLVRHLPHTGVQVKGVVAGMSSVAHESEGRVRSFAPTSASLLSRWRGARRMIGSELAQNRFTMVASHFAFYTFPVLDLIQPYPLVIHFHGPWASEGSVEGGGGLNTKVKFALERAVYRRGTRFITLSDAFRDVLHNLYKVPRERIHAVPGGVEARRFATTLTRRETRERLGWPQDRPTLVTVRRLARRMGLESLIEAIKEVRRRVPEILLLIGGKGRLSGELSARVLSLGLEKNVRFLGFVPDGQLPLAYRAADLSVVPTVTLEGFGLIAVESLAAGTPALVTPVGGLPEAVRDLSPALVLPGTGVRSLAEGIRAALTGELTLPSAEVCQDYVRSRYDWPVVAARIRTVYEEALS